MIANLNAPMLRRYGKAFRQQDSDTLKKPLRQTPNGARHDPCLATPPPHPNASLEERPDLVLAQGGHEEVKL